MKTYAGIGSRHLSTVQRNLCVEIGAWLASKGWTLHTGGCAGADMAFIEGALSADGQVHVFKPWASYNFAQLSPLSLTSFLLHPGYVKAWESVDRFHPAPEKLTSAARSLLARNYLIVEDVKFVIALPTKTGGTTHTMTVAASLGKEIFDLSDPDQAAKIISKIRQKP